jgi:catechol 2,3-dioxygenase-like lactoylglutathione lyase family enzyme
MRSESSLEPDPAPSWRFDHLNLHGRADSALGRLFGDVMGLRPGYRPPFPFPGQWLYRDDQALLHVVQAPAAQGEAVRLGHIAFRTEASADSVIERLRASDLAYEVAVVPEEGSVQIFVQLPGGLVIELDTPADPNRIADAYASRLARATTSA